MTREQKLSARARFALLRMDCANEGERAALDAAIGVLDIDLEGYKTFIELSQPESSI